ERPHRDRITDHRGTDGRRIRLDWCGSEPRLPLRGVEPLERRLLRRGAEAVVAVGSLKLTVPFATLRRLSARHLREEKVAIIDVPELEAKPEVDVRGVRVHEVDDLVVHALDAAIRADLRLLRIIHGKGTGALRERVGQVLTKDRRVAQFRLGAWNEGGAGVTIAEFA
ncbi:MAG: Smr/MutS family protein, partial [Gemmatimonadota bacterium]